MKRARKEEIEKLGITQEMLDSAEQVGIALEQATEGFEATKASLESQQSLARRLEHDSEELYEKAKASMSEDKEEEARKFLFQRNDTQERLTKVLKSCVEEKQRFEKMKDNVAAMEKRALEIESLLQRSVGAKARLDVPTDNLSLPPEDPLLQKFRDLGID